SKPKQFLDILGVGTSLLQQTFDRFAAVMPAENIYIVSNAEYRDVIKEQLPGMKEANILLEPYRRNTAPCLAYAAYCIRDRDPEARMIVAPSDHLILKEGVFSEVVKKGLDFVGAHDALLTLGIQPSRPETGYGYIQAEAESLDEGKNCKLQRVKTFTEKPDQNLARVFYESGEFYWNAGIFFWSLKSVLDAFDRYLPDVSSAFEEGAGIYGTDNEPSFIEETYAGCKNISIDYGIMEKADNVYVLATDIGWSDLGTWGSLYDQADHDQSGNALMGDQIFAYDTKNSLINVSGKKLVVVQGVEDFVVVDSDDVLLICKMDEEQRIKTFVNDVKLKNGETFI
ncbi:MAG TPA: mannose-1-phosphate guanylyltransferase, partial [Bacteroidales bacterium]|nr:mannose-1-phosphate guanylyltransferase [Bacteroidales bacterium]